MREFTALHSGGYRAWLTQAERWLVGEGVVRTVEVLRKTYDDSQWLVNAASANRDSRPHYDDADEQHVADLINDALNSTVVNLSRPETSAAIRLLPDACDDPQVAQRFRELTQQNLTELKYSRLVEFHGLLNEAVHSDDPNEHEPLDIAADKAELVIAAMSDIRLVLADQLHVDDELISEELQDRVLSTFFTVDGLDPESGPPQVTGDDLLAAAFVVIGFLQQSLVDEMLNQFDEDEAVE